MKEVIDKVIQMTKEHRLIWCKDRVGTYPRYTTYYHSGFGMIFKALCFKGVSFGEGLIVGGVEIDNNTEAKRLYDFLITYPDNTYEYADKEEMIEGVMEW